MFDGKSLRICLLSKENRREVLYFVHIGKQFLFRFYAPKATELLIKRDSISFWLPFNALSRWILDIFVCLGAPRMASD
jgi:hypothetical protein